jgi:hypothetical protein
VSHGGSGPRHRYLAYMIGHSGPREVLAPRPHRSGNATPPNGCAFSPERLRHYPRNGCAFSPGMAAPFGPEGAPLPRPGEPGQEPATADPAVRSRTAHRAPCTVPLPISSSVSCINAGDSTLYPLSKPRERKPCVQQLLPTVTSGVTVSIWPPSWELSWVRRGGVDRQLVEIGFHMNGA